MNCIACLGKGAFCFKCGAPARTCQCETHKTDSCEACDGAGTVPSKFDYDLDAANETLDESEDQMEIET